MAIEWRRCWGLTSVILGLGVLAGCPGGGSSGGGNAVDLGADASDDADAGPTDAGAADDDDKPTGGKGGAPAKPTKPAQGGAGGSQDAGEEPSQPADPDDDVAAGSGGRFFLPTIEPTNTTAPRLLADAKGGTHMLYPTYGAGGAFYAYCPDGCSGYEDIEPVLLPTDGTVGNAALALTRDGKPRALLSTLLRVYYAECDANCSDEASWSVTPIIEHQGDQDVTGQALAIDPEGRPRFIMHTYLAYLGVGQKPPKTWMVGCDEDCTSADSWQQFEIAEDKIWYRSQLIIDDSGAAHLLTAVENADGMSAGLKLAAYLECPHSCNTADAWSGVGLVELYESTVEEIKPSTAMALTKAGQPRLLLLERGGPNNKRLLYFECDGNCTEDNWTGSALSDLSELGSGLDLVLDAQDHPHFVFTLDWNIGLYHCTSASCASDDADWQLTEVELSGNIPKDEIILWPNCTVAAWMLHQPSLALGRDGSVKVGYQATDLSGGVQVIDPTKPACVAGKDMTLSRMTMLAASAVK